jgi:hypothetical protein
MKWFVVHQWFDKPVEILSQHDSRDAAKNAMYEMKDRDYIKESVKSARRLEYARDRMTDASREIFDAAIAAQGQKYLFFISAVGDTVVASIDIGIGYEQIWEPGFMTRIVVAETGQDALDLLLEEEERDFSLTQLYDCIEISETDLPMGSVRDWDVVTAYQYPPEGVVNGDGYYDGSDDPIEMYSFHLNGEELRDAIFGDDPWLSKMVGL